MCNNREKTSDILFNIMSESKVSRETAAFIWYTSDTMRNMNDRCSTVDLYNRMRKEVYTKEYLDAHPCNAIKKCKDDCCTIVCEIVEMIAKESKISIREAYSIIKKNDVTCIFAKDEILKCFKRDNYKNAVRFFTTLYEPWKYNYLREVGYEN